MGDTPRWLSGDAIAISAPGEQLPAFVVSIGMPETVDMLDPDIETLGDGELHISRDAPFAVSWTPVNADVQIDIYQGDGDVAVPDLLEIICTFPGPDGTAEMPASVMALFSDEPLEAGMNLGAIRTATSSLGGRPRLALVGHVTWRRVVIE